MSLNKDEAVEKARKDMAKRLAISEGDIVIKAVESADFPDAALGASGEDEMSAQVITSGWRIRLRSGDQKLEYRANKDQLRLYNFKGENHKI